MENVGKMENGYVFSMSYGLVVFDPMLLNNFITKKNIKKKNLYKHFTDSKDGDEVISKGILLPMYPLTASNYKIEPVCTGKVNLKNRKIILEKGVYKFLSSSGRICIGDISLIEDWDYSDYNKIKTIERGVVSIALINKVLSNVKGVKIYGFKEDFACNDSYGYIFDFILEPKEFNSFDLNFEIITP